LHPKHWQRIREKRKEPVVADKDPLSAEESAEAIGEINALFEDAIASVEELNKASINQIRHGYLAWQEMSKDDSTYSAADAARDTAISVGLGISAWRAAAARWFRPPGQ
jgi:hypothetical protein